MTQKRRGETLALIPLPRPSHCLYLEISNLASPRQRYYKRSMLPANTGWHAYGYNTPTWTPRCEIFWGTKGCEVLEVEDNVWNVLSAPRAIRFTTLMRSDGAEIYVLTRPPWGWRIICKVTENYWRGKGEASFCTWSQDKRLQVFPSVVNNLITKSCLFIARIYQSNYSQKNYTYCSENY